MVMRGSHIYLSSKSCLNIFPDNKPDTFTNLLPEPLNLSHGRYEVSLEEIQFVMALPTLKELEFTIINNSRSSPVTTAVTLNKQSPESIVEFVKLINSVIPPSLKNKVKFGHTNGSMLTKAKVSSGYKIVIPEEWKQILGFDEITLEGDVTGVRPADICNGVHTAFVVCDISRPVPLGDRYRNVLGCLELPSGRRNTPTVVSKISTPSFVPIIDDYIQTITISLTDETGNPLPLRLHPTTVKLVIRRIQRETTSETI